MKAINTPLGPSALDDSIWEMMLGLAPAIEEAPPKHLPETGDIQGAPLEPFPEASPDPEAIVDTLVSFDYPAANTRIPIDGPCEYDIVGSIASYAEKMTESGDSSDTEFASNADFCELTSAPRGDSPDRPDLGRRIKQRARARAVLEKMGREIMLVGLHVHSRAHNH